MSEFKKLPTTILGDLGEKYISEFAKSKGAKPYIPAYPDSFPVDSICLKNGKVFAVEVKTKPRMTHYELSGYDHKDHQTYVTLDFPVYVLFVDHITKSMYGNWASELDKQPKSFFSGGVIAFPLSAMTIYRGLGYTEVDALKKLSNSNYA